MDALSFHPSRAKRPRALGAVQIGSAKHARNYRITHVFGAHLYLMPVTTAAKGHDAARPQRWRIRDIDELVARGRAVYGSIRLPPEMATAIRKEAAPQVGRAFARIEPLLAAFSRESALGRSFTGTLKEQAANEGIPLASLRRMLLRYWYFGGIDQALLPLQRGPRIAVDAGLATGTEHSRKAGAAAVRRGAAPPRARAGPKPRHVVDVRPCFWSPEAIDVADMERAAIRCARRRIKGFEALTDEYLRCEFKKRHPKVYKLFMNGHTTVPCTERQLRYRLRRKAALDPRVLTGFPTLGKRASQRVLLAVGSGHIYELDATGGQIYIVDAQDPTRVLRKVTIYLIIDRYSRYVVSVYITAKPPSSAGVRQALRIAFTSRRRRFQNMGIDIDDDDWPPGVFCLTMVVDNGPDMISKATLKTAVHDLGIDVDILPPYTPDGKAIIERFIKTLKTKMQAKGLAGLYKKVQLSPDERRAAKNAIFIAELSLRSLYRELIEIVRVYNHARHTGLEQRLPELAIASVPFTPIAAYRYGLEHVSGLERPALSDEDIFQLTLAPHKARIEEGVVTWKGLTYYPANAAAVAFAARFGGAAVTIDVKVDATDPFDLYADSSMMPLPMWRLDPHGEAFVRAVCVEDWEEFSEERELLKADTARRNAITRQKTPDAHPDVKAPALSARRQARTKADPTVARRRSVEESNALDAALAGRGASTSPSHSPERSPTTTGATATRAAIDFRAEEAARLEAIAKRHSTEGFK